MSIVKLAVTVVGLVCVAVAVKHKYKADQAKAEKLTKISSLVKKMETEHASRGYFTDAVHRNVIHANFRKAC